MRARVCVDFLESNKSFSSLKPNQGSSKDSDPSECHV